MLDFVASVVWAVVAAYAVREFAGVGQAFVARLGDFKPTREPLVPDPPPPIPDDLAALAFGQSEAWAKEDLLKVIREKYEEHQDWNKVRVAFGVARMPE